MAIQSDSKKYLYGNGSARLPSAGGCCWLSYLSDLKFGISGHNYSLISPLLPGTYLIIYIGTKLVWKCNISLTTQVKILPQMIVFAAHKKYDYQIKCHPGCCIFNTHSCLLILPPLLSSWSEPPFHFPKNKQTNTRTIFVVYLFLTSIPITSPIFLLPPLPLVWALLSARCYQCSPLTIPKWRETYLPRGLSECLPKITLIPNSLLKYLKTQ